MEPVTATSKNTVSADYRERKPQLRPQPSSRQLPASAAAPVLVHSEPTEPGQLHDEWTDQPEMQSNAELHQPPALTHTLLSTSFNFCLTAQFFISGPGCKNPTFFKKAQPGGFIGFLEFYWVKLGFCKMLNLTGSESCTGFQSLEWALQFYS